MSSLGDDSIAYYIDEYRFLCYHKFSKPGIYELHIEGEKNLYARVKVEDAIKFGGSLYKK